MPRNTSAVPSAPLLRAFAAMDTPTTGGAAAAPRRIQIDHTEIARALLHSAGRKRQQAATEVARVASLIADIEHDVDDVASMEGLLRGALKDLRDTMDEERQHRAVFAGEAEYEVAR